jgi:hypothetical protein
MINSFNTNIACTYSVNTAIFVQQLAQWTFVNLANNRNIHDGHCWSYNSQEALSIIFPYWSRQNLRTIIKECLKNGLIIKGNYNKHRYDKTTWYALTEKGLTYFPELENLKSNLLLNDQEPPESSTEKPWLESTKGSAQINQPIPTINSTNKKDITKVISKKYAFISSTKKTADISFDSFWTLYPVKKAKQLCWQYWDKHKLDNEHEEIMTKLGHQIVNDDHFLQGYIRNPLKYLREEGWLDPINVAKDKRSSEKDFANYNLGINL